MILLKDIRWVYQGADTAVLHGLDLYIRRGETVVLCGPSGSGKSTALRLMNGLIPFFHEGTLDGEVRVRGEPITDLAQVGRVTGTVLQHPRRQFFTDAIDTELAFALENFGTPPQRIRDRVGEVIAELGLADLTGRLRELSGGQQQRVACAAAITHGPPLLLLDEPTSNLSPRGIADLTAILRHLREQGVTLVIAEHRLHYLRELADRIVVLQDGRVGREWTRAEFAGLTDEMLREEGLRGLDAPGRAGVAPAFAYGPSVEPGESRPRETAPAGEAGERAGVATAPGPGAGGAGVALRGIRCAFGGRPVLDIAEAHLPAGVITAVTGPNGAGKTTLARILAGLQRHAGQVLLDGRPLSRSRRQRACAIVMQDVQRQLFTDSVTAELRLGTTPDHAEHAAAVVADLGLDGLGDRHPLSLSGGQQQRLVVATARLSGSSIVIFDEPSSGVDRRHLQSMTRTMRDVAANGAVVVLISHDADLLALAADQELRLCPLR
ncbi:ABC transporter ATP-binding protein [Microtetraspora sp. NBRC 16547]|uniref:energy-coupling factor ABC transporter ATP-binding protein n=1 Tax=Microtetraspora sp. NBRC 16547 TaxID=3030993 RepID=UPI0024A42F0A|nr:ABC transporter ATP-binding protein [Microtetraspora sp. NBRC 16547]GLX02162.1 ABC transporter ATP-binding protein [Microtetraspora sp. NBRC 16547]